MRPSCGNLKLGGDDMKVMVLGASGFTGRPLVRWLAGAGHDVLAVTRTGEDAQAPPGVTAMALDRGDPIAIAKAAGSHSVEAVIDLLAMTLAATQPLLEALSGRVGRYVMASSGDVYRRYGALHRLESADRPILPLDEDAPLRTRLHPYRATPPRAADDPQAWMDDYDKIPIERAVAARMDLPAVVMRLPMIYGPRDRQRRFAWAIKPMLAKAPVIEVDAQWAAWRATYGYVDDVAAGLGLAATHPAARGRTYNLGPLAADDHAHWAGRFAALLGWAGELRPIPREEVAEPVRVQLDSLDLAWPMVTDTRRIRAELGYREVALPEDALRRTIEDELARSPS
jgi:nucleoside-diphosphate-sugar epimerase